jgi:transcriptional regulator with XRE-family HTH domain
MTEETTGQRLKRLRQSAGMTQPQLAEAAGVPVGTLRCWEQERRNMLFVNAIEIARAIGISLDELAGVEAPGTGAVGT